MGEDSSMGNLEKTVAGGENIKDTKSIKGGEDSYYVPSQRDSSGGASMGWFIPVGVYVYTYMGEMPSKIFGGVLVAAGIVSLMLEGYIRPIELIKDIREIACYQFIRKIESHPL